MILNNFKTDIGIVSFMAYPEIGAGKGQILESISKIAKDPFFSLIEITHIEDSSERDKVKNILEISNIRVSFGAHPVTFEEKLNVNSSDDEEREKSVDKLKRLIDEAYYMDAESFVFVSGPRSEGLSMEAELEILTLSIKELLSYSREISQKSGKKIIDMILETFDDRPFAKKRLIGPTEVSVKLSRDIRKQYKEFGLLLDLSHLPILGEDCKRSAVKAKEHIKHIHIGNCILKDTTHAAYGDEHPRFCIEGGEIYVEELAVFLKKLDEIGYLSSAKSAVSFEIKPLKGEDPDITIAGSKRILLKAIKMANLM